MLTYLLRRLSFAVLLVFTVSSASLVLARLAPGDYAVGAVGLGSASALEEARRRDGLDRPIAEQYASWLRGAARLDFGRSLAYDRPVSDLVPERALNTTLLAFAALALATLVGVPLGVLTGTSRGGIAAGLVRAGSVVFLSTPPLLTSLFLLFLAGRSGWLPIAGMWTGSADTGGDAGTAVSALLDLLAHMVVPVLALALPLAALFERLQSQAMAEAMRQPFVRAARARGVGRIRLVWRDALRPGIRPLLSIYGVVVGTLLSGSFAVEIVTAWPGLGHLMLEALRARDVYLVAGCAAAGSVFLAAGTLISDAALALADPRTSE